MFVLELFDDFWRRNAICLRQAGQHNQHDDRAQNEANDYRYASSLAESDDLRERHCSEIGRQTDELEGEPADLIGEGFILL